MRAPRLLIGIAVLGALSASARTTVAAGGAATIGQFPFVVGVRTATGFCTGTLIRDDWVLTSAHCGDGGAPQLVFVADRGTFGPTALIDDVPIARWIPHPDYAGVPGSASDIALIEMAEGAALHRPAGEYGEPYYTPSPITPATGPASPGGGIGPVAAAVLPLGTGDSITRWMDGLATFPSGLCGAQQPPLDPSRQLCLAPFPDACDSAGGGPVFIGTGTSRALYGILSKVGTGAGCATSRAVFTYVPAFRDWIAQTIDAGGPGGPIQLGWELPSNSTGIATGISNVQGWAYSRAGAIASIRLERVNAQGVIRHILTVPCCSERADVLAAFPDAPVATGFSAAINWANLGRNPAYLTLIVRDTAGNERRERRTVQPVRILPGETYPTGLEFTDASTCTFGNQNGRATIECTGLEFAENDCRGGLKLRWVDDKQAFEIAEGCR